MGQTLSPARENFPAIMFLCLYGALYCYLVYEAIKYFRQRPQSEESTNFTTGGASRSSWGEGGRKWEKKEGGRYPIVQRYMEKLKRQDERMRTSEGRARYLGGGFFLNMLTEEDKEENANEARDTNQK